MVLKLKDYTPQEYIHIGMAFFLIGLSATMIGNGRLIGVLFANVIPDKSLLDAIQGFATGFSIPICCASIFFNLRGLSMLRSQ